MNETSVETYKLLENLLTWSRAQTSNIAYSPSEFDIREVIDECALLVSKQAQLKDIGILKEYSSAMVSADKNMVMTVIRNLLSNAVKFTPRQGTIRVSSSDENGHVRIKISDNGVGMPEEKLNSLFHVHINSSTRGTENESGIGLGLIIADEFVRINKGNLQVESKINEGSTFSFTLPVVN
jgi:signal transduction histidine kinase